MAIKNAYRYKWRPSASQRRAFAEKMKDPKEKAAYEERKRKKQEYSSWEHKNFVPTENQFNLCRSLRSLNNLTPEQLNAINQVESAYLMNEKVSHDYIHIVNQLGRDLGWDGFNFTKKLENPRKKKNSSNLKPLDETKNQFRLRLNDPESYIRFITVHSKNIPGVDYLIGFIDDVNTEIQSIRFDKKKWTKSKIINWWKANRVKFLKHILHRTKKKNPGVKQEAKKKFLDFTGKSRVHIKRTAINIPDEVIKIGKATEITYLSDKWDGKKRLYVHHLKKHGDILVFPDGQGILITGLKLNIKKEGLTG